MAIKAVPLWYVRKQLRGKVTLLKVKEIIDETDEYGQETKESITKFSLKAQIDVITPEDLTWLPPGLLRVGDARGFFLPYYTLDGKKISVDLKDYIVFDQHTFVVDRIEDIFYGKDIVYREAYLRRVED